MILNSLTDLKFRFLFDFYVFRLTNYYKILKNNLKLRMTDYITFCLVKD